MSATHKVAILGQGYVGLPLALAVSASKFTVHGVDTDADRVFQLSKGISPIEEIDSRYVQNMLSSDKYIISNSLDKNLSYEIFIVCVPTPLTEDRKPDLRYLIDAVSSVGQALTKNSLVIIESTIEPGTTRGLVNTILKSKSGLADSEFYLAFSPERIDPNNSNWNLKNTPKLVSGITKESAELARDFYLNFVDQVYTCDSLEIAETAKLLENTFRFVNISFINEISILCEKLGIDVNAVIKAAGTKPYGFMQFYPSIGIGGHCIPVDPLYMANKAKEIDAPFRFIILADEINTQMPLYFSNQAKIKLGSLIGKRILVVGVSYKSNIADVRESPVKSLIMELRQNGAQVNWHDDLVKEWCGEIKPTRAKL